MFANGLALRCQFWHLEVTDNGEQLMAKKGNLLIPTERIERAIILIRGEKVMLDSDLATLYGVTTSQLNQAVKRNRERFPQDFMFRLKAKESEALQVLKYSDSGSRSQSVILKRGTNVKYFPYVFTEQGVAMLSSVLRSPRAVEVNIEIMRAFVRLRQMIASHADLARRLDELEKKCDKQFAVVFDAIRQLMEPPTDAQRREMGYHTLIKQDGKPSARQRRLVSV